MTTNITTKKVDALFSGKKELLKGLHAEEFLNRSDFEPNPVIRLDMSKVVTDGGIDTLKKSMKQVVMEVANKEAIRQILVLRTKYEVEDKNYAELYPDAICIGLAIDDTQRQITKFDTLTR